MKGGCEGAWTKAAARIAVSGHPTVIPWLALAENMAVLHFLTCYLGVASKRSKGSDSTVPDTQHTSSVVKTEHTVLVLKEEGERARASKDPGRSLAKQWR